jgi:hypothetical protein
MDTARVCAPYNKTNSSTSLLISHALVSTSSSLTNNNIVLVKENKIQHGEKEKKERKKMAGEIFVD